MWGCCQHIGEKRPKAAGDAVGTTIVLFFIIGITLTVILEIFAGNIAEIMRRRKQPEKMY
ncbi:MATE family efflux transporter [[Clostridium] scindens]|uniref:MATE family efflux transporter n=2 Tax=Clostridium scindens (strain JCM 10418 / VPI 12708) TaxID=29347 RepID=UPI003AB8DDA3